MVQFQSQELGVLEQDGGRILWSALNSPLELQPSNCQVIRLIGLKNLRIQITYTCNLAMGGGGSDVRQKVDKARGVTHPHPKRLSITAKTHCLLRKTVKLFIVV